MPRRGQAFHERRVLDRPHSVLDAVGAERIEPPRTDSGPASSPACGVERRPPSRAITNASANGSGGAEGFVVRETEHDEPMVAGGDGQPRLVDRVGGIDGAVGGQHDADADRRAAAPASAAASSTMATISESVPIRAR